MGKSKKKKTVKKVTEIDANNIPRSFVFHRGEVGTTIMQLITNMRQVMEPYTATNLKVLKSNVLKDFIHVAGPYGISHFVMFSKSELSPYMRICRLPRGPTLTFKLNQYSLMKDVIATLRRPKTFGQQFRFPPLVVVNNFNGELQHMKLMTSIFQNMFPSIKVHKVKLAEIRRCVMFNYNSEDQTIDFRHYNIEAVPVGVNRGVKKLLKDKVPNLGSLNEIADFVTGAAYLSESEGEEPEDSRITLPQRVLGKGNTKSSQSAIKLIEMGPRLNLELVKIEEGLNDGEVLYHKYVRKSKKEIKENRMKKQRARQLKEQRKRQQEDNVKRKEKDKEENKVRSLAGMKRKLEEDDQSNDRDHSAMDVNDGNESGNSDPSEIDDEEYFRQEVGEEPDVDLLMKKPRNNKEAFSTKKKRKFDAEKNSDGPKVNNNMKKKYAPNKRDNLKKNSKHQSNMTNEKDKKIKKIKSKKLDSKVAQPKKVKRFKPQRKTK